MTTYQGITHVHSTYSFDGTMRLAEIRTLCQQAGYSFALMAEHIEGMTSERLAEFLGECRERSDGEFLFVPGLEFHAECLSVNGILEPVIIDGHRRELLEKCMAQGTFNVLVHPRLLVDRRRAALPHALHAVEVWNAKYDGARYPSPRALALFEELARERGCGAVVGIDLHQAIQLVPLYVSVELERLAMEPLLEALRAGRHRIGRGGVVLDAALSPMTRFRVGAYGILRDVASMSYGPVRRLLPAAIERRLKTWINGRQYE